MHYEQLNGARPTTDSPTNLPAGPSGMAFVYTWLRLSNARLLDWSRSFSYQPKDIAWAQQQVGAWVVWRSGCVGGDACAKGEWVVGAVLVPQPPTAHP